MAGAGAFAGIGFTMSLFITGLAYTGEMRDQAKIAILAASALSGVLGCLLLLAFLPGQIGSPLTQKDTRGR